MRVEHWVHIRDRCQVLNQLLLNEMTASVISYQYTAEWVLCLLSALSITQQTYRSSRTDRTLHKIICTYTLHLTLAGRSAHVQWISCALKTRFTAKWVTPVLQRVLGTRAPLMKLVGESRLMSSGEPFISSRGAFERSLDELSWWITHDPQAIARWCLMQSCRWFNIISHIQDLRINKIQNLNQHKHGKMQWTRRQCEI